MDGPEFGEQVYAPTGDYDPQDVAADHGGRPAGREEALGSYTQHPAGTGGPVWGPDDERRRPSRRA